MEKGKSSREGYKRSGIFRVQTHFFNERLMKRNLYVGKKGQVDLLDQEMVVLLQVASGSGKEELNKFKQQEPKLKGKWKVLPVQLQDTSGLS